MPTVAVVANMMCHGFIVITMLSINRSVIVLIDRFRIEVSSLQLNQEAINQEAVVLLCYGYNTSLIKQP